MFSTALAVVSDYVLDFCLKRDFDDSSCSKTNEVFLTMINGSLAGHTLHAKGVARETRLRVLLGTGWMPQSGCGRVTHAHPRPIPTDQPAGWTGSCSKPRRAIYM